MPDDSYDFSFDDYLTQELGIDPEQMETLNLNYGNEGSTQGLSGIGEADPTAYADENYGNEGKHSGLGNISPSSSVEEPGLIRSALSGASSWIKDNKELASMIGSGIVGAVKDKNAREMSQAQIDYYKQRQQDLNNSVKSYTRNPNQKA